MMKKTFALAMILLLIFSMFKIVSYDHESDENMRLNGKLKLVRLNELTFDEKNKKKDEFVPEDNEARTLPEINPDYVGWLSIEGVIELPVVLGENNDFYLTHDFYKNRSVYGTAFLDANFKSNAKIQIIYAHNMTDGQMFTPLINYRDQDYYENHKKILFSEYEYEVIAVNEVNIKEDEYQYWNNQYTNTQVNRMIEHFIATSLVSTENMNKNADDGFLLLSTCIQYEPDMRFLICLKRMDVTG